MLVTKRQEGNSVSLLHFEGVSHAETAGENSWASQVGVT